ncbi:hypothetical protein NHQ30_009945 [Ciborinia camelliae]|nr:hypothetical protein NHQ30_009945 [Ciborinia camelliae]
MADNNRYSDLQRHVFGRTFSQHRKDSMQKILGFLQEKGYSRYTKTQLMHRLSQVERYLPYAQQVSIEHWLESGSKGPIVHLFTRQGDRSAHLQPYRVSKRRGTNKSPRKQVDNATIKREKTPEPKVELRECSICAEELTPDNFPHHNITSDCAHDAACCYTCLSQCIGVQIESKQWDQITCPECPALLSFDNVKTFASETDFIRYDKKSLLSYIRNDPNFTNCLGPNCGDGQIHEDGDEQPIMTCGSCGFKTCFTHSIPWHTGLTCSQYDIKKRQRAERQIQEDESQKQMEKSTKRCPNCQVRIEKNHGCDHMTCSSCRHEFCWLCFVDYKSIRSRGNSAHVSTCSYYPRNLPRHPEQEPDPIPRIPNIRIGAGPLRFENIMHPVPRPAAAAPARPTRVAHQQEPDPAPRIPNFMLGGRHFMIGGRPLRLENIMNPVPRPAAAAPARPMRVAASTRTSGFRMGPF